LINGSPVKLSKLLNTNLNYEDQKKLAAGYGIELFEANVAHKNSYGIRIRPRIANWSINFGISARLNLQDDDPQQVNEIMTKLFEVAGTQCGICDWRPSSPKKRGVHGVFSTKLTRVV
jgi:hypothetical protein